MDSDECDQFDGKDEEYCPKCDEYFTPWITACKCHPKRAKTHLDEVLAELGKMYGQDKKNDPVQF